MIHTWSIEINRGLISNCYYFFLINQKYPSQRGLNNLNKSIEIFKKMSGKWNGQSKAEYEKNYKRIQDIIEKSAGDHSMGMYLAKQQANKITDEFKALNRAMAAKEMNQEHIFEVFFQRAYELGSVTKQEYREYKLEKLGI